MRTTLKLTEIIDGWIADTDILPATKADYRRKINLWFRWLSSVDVDPRSPQRHHIVEYKRWLQEEGRSVLTVCSYVTVVKLFYRYCEQMGYYNLSLFYIKPQPLPAELTKSCTTTYPFSTSNHNCVSSDGKWGDTTTYPFSTSNHNGRAVVELCVETTTYPFSTSNHNPRHEKVSTGLTTTYPFSTSNHNIASVPLNPNKTTTYPFSTSNHNIIPKRLSKSALQLIPFLHQTTTL